MHKNHRAKQVGTELVKELIKIANVRGYATMIAGIDTSNKNSKIMHEKLGFEYTGTLRKVGFKFGRWLDLAFYQKELLGPVQPVDG